MNDYIKPSHLKQGDIIGIVSPSAPIAGLLPCRVARGVKMLESLGFRVILGKNSLKVTGYTAGTAEQRAEDINSFIRNDDVKGIFSFIGGNHSNQILEYLDFSAMKKTPKIFLGYSDATILHFAFATQSNITSFYGPAVLTQFAEFPEIFPYTEEYFAKALMTKNPIGKVFPSKEWTDEVLDWFNNDNEKKSRKLISNKGWEWIKSGRAEGPILGGCITSIMHLRGTKYWPDFSKKILFWEIPEGDDFSKGENVANIDAYLTDLKLSGVFAQISGMIIGRPFGYDANSIQNLTEIIKRQIDGYEFPVLFGVDIGHSDPMITIPIGASVIVDSLDNNLEFTESGVV